MEKIRRISETRNGMRQPHSENWAGVMMPLNRHTPMMISAMNRPSVAVVWIHAVS
jgi:hypothetical protein